MADIIITAVVMFVVAGAIITIPWERNNFFFWAGAGLQPIQYEFSSEKAKTPLSDCISSFKNQNASKSDFFWPWTPGPIIIGRFLISLLVYIFHGLVIWGKDTLALLGVAPSSISAFSQLGTHSVLSKILNLKKNYDYPHLVGWKMRRFEQLVQAYTSKKGDLRIWTWVSLTLELTFLFFE